MRKKESAAYPELPQVSPLRVRDLPPDARPREKMEHQGATALTNEELLAILLGSGTKGFNVLEVARALLKKYGSLTALAEDSPLAFKRVRGIGPAKSKLLKAALELARRMSREKLDAQQLVRTPEDVVNVLGEEARGRGQEVLWMLPLDVKYRLKRPPVAVTLGLADASLAHPREVFREAIACGSSALVLAHNHPSGDPTPSAEDIRLTR
ncbi:MAG: DNA repair protein RadC, partial [Kiritimatiellaeota bacterium]|nr:DNA repair protein RadC [Kiritimatiellota bacterium]